MGARFKPVFGLLFLISLTIGIAYSATPTTCIVSAVPPLVHSEGLAERIGDIVLQCTGAPSALVNANLTVYLPVSITNRIDVNSFSTDATLTIDTGSGPVPSGVSGFVANQSISFNGFGFTFPATGTAVVRITDLRADVNQLGAQQQIPIQASLSSTLALTNNPVTVAVARQGLLSSTSSSGVRCTGSPLPSTLSLTNLFSTGTVKETTRITAGYAGAFEPKDPTSDTGTRVLLNYANFPTGATILVPDAIAGSTASQPTAGGDLGMAAAVGEYTPGSHSLLLVRVLNADDTGTGGILTALPAPNTAGVLVLDSVNPVSLTNGAGYAVYEVVDSSGSAAETAQIPSFFGILPNTPPTVANLSVSLAPVSSLATASTSAPIPRFASVQPASDCTLLGDCNASYFPVLQVNAQPMQVSAVSGGKRVAAGAIGIKNLSGGTLVWQATITYTTGTGWLVLSATSGIGSASIGVFADPAALAPGVYQAAVLVDAGTMAGSKGIPVTLTVTPASSTVVITSITNAADFHAGPVVPGSLAAIFGTGLAGQNVSVTFDGNAANLLYTGAKQINLRIPTGLAGHLTAQMVVTVDGTSSAPFVVQLAAVAPAIFSPGVLNQDNTLNSPANPVPAGTVLQIFGTGMPDSGGTIFVNIQNSNNLVPLYAGAAPGLPGVQQVNVGVPSNLQSGAASLTICGVSAANQRYCSQPVTVSLQ
jgi:uncharacterized protein (TIGR03437 family)